MKKVLSLVLVLALVLGSFSMAFAAETKTTNMSDVAGNANEGAIVVANDLGIVTGYNDGTFKPANAVTRAEFAAMMTRALAIPESALKGFKTSSFKDVASDHWAVAYLGYCNSKGIMTGYEDGTARPNQTITVNEAITMICRALGYTAQAKELVGSWPANYIALGQQLSLYDDVNAVATVDRASAAQIVYNSLTVAKVYIDADGATKYVMDPTATFALTMLDTLGCENDGDKVINTGMVKTAKTDISKLLGAYATVYSKNGDVIAAKELSTFITGTYDNDDEKLITDDDVEYDLSNMTVKTGAVSITNGVSAAYVPLGAGDDDKTFTIAAKISGKTVKEIYSVAKWDKTTNYYAYLYEEDMLDVDKCKLNGKSFAKDDNGEIDMNSFILSGVASLDKIVEDNVVEVYTNATGEITKIEVGTQTVTGIVTKMASDKAWAIIDGTKYKANDKNTLDIDVKQSGTAYLTFGGKIFDWDIEDAAAGNYAVLLSYAQETKFDTTYSFKLFTKDGKTITPEYDITAASYTALAVPANKGKIFEYSLDNEGNLDSLKDVTADASATQGAVKIGKSHTTYGTMPIVDDVVVFIEDSDGDWSIGNIKDFKTDATLSLTRCAIDGNKIKAIAVADTYAIGSTATYGIINSATISTNDDGKKVWFVDGFNDGKALSAVTKISSSDSSPVISDIGDTYGGLYEVKVDANGVVTAVNAINPANLAQAPVEVATVASVKTKTNTVEITTNTKATYVLTKNVVIYYYDADEEEYVIIKSTELKNKHAFLIQTDDDLDGADIVVAFDN